MLFVSLLGGVFSSVVGQNRLDSVQVIDEIVVEAQKSKEIIAPEKLSGETLNILNRLPVADAIRYFSGMQLKDFGGVAGFSTINIRSMGTNAMNVFYDGIQLGNAQNGQIDLGRFSLDNLEEISLYSGQKSEIMQSAKDFGASGSIYLVSKKPRFENGKLTNVKVSLKAGSFDLINPAILYEHKINEKLSSSFSGEWINGSGKYKFRYRRLNPLGELVHDTTATRQNSDINILRLEAGLNGLIDNGSWQMRGYVYSSEKGIPGAIVNGDFRKGERLRDVSSFLQGTFKKDVTRQFSTLLNARYAYDNTHYENFDVILVDADNQYKQKEFYLSSANLYNITRDWDASLSYDFQWNKLDADLSEFPFPTRYTNMVSLATAYKTKHLKAQASVLGTFVNESVEQYAKAPNRSKVTPSLFLSYQPFLSQDLLLSAFYKELYRMPTFNDLYYMVKGNASLKPEWEKHYNVGLKYTYKPKQSLLQKIGLDVNAFYRETENKIVSFPNMEENYRWVTMNLGYVEAKGLNASLEGSVLLKKVLLSAKVQYTYEEARDKTDRSDTYYNDFIPYIPKHSGSVVSMIHYDGWTMNYSLIYTGERYSQQENILYNYVQPWYTSDVSVMKSFKWGGFPVKVSVEVNNLFAQDYDIILNYPMPLRNYRAYVSVEF